MEGLQFCMLILALSLFHTSHGYGAGVLWNFKNLKLKVDTKSSEGFELGSVPDQYLEQPLDHFDASVKDTYQQRYWVNQSFFLPHGPVFLYIGGEGALSNYTVLRGEHIALAEKYHALVFAVEHRFYGKSINQNGLQSQNLRFLSSQQALADLASFHEFASKKYGLTEDNKWVCYGGSYPGALSAWFRIKYPHLVHAAVASSAPVQARENFEGYNDVVSAAFSDPVVNGSAKCQSIIQQSFQDLDKQIDEGNFNSLATAFQTCKILQKNSPDIQQFASNLAGIFMGTAQYNLITPGLNISRICHLATSAASPIQALAAINTEYLKDTGEKCMDNSWSGFLDLVKDTNVSKHEIGVGLRQWLYQTCSQFGYYQTCDKNTSCIFSRYITLQPNLDICSSVFGISSTEVASRCAFTNDFYGGNQPRGSRIVFVNGSIDPWHKLSVLKELPNQQLAVYINGTAHCANMADDRPGDMPQLLKARKEIEGIVGLWLKVPRSRNHQYLRFGGRKL